MANDMYGHFMANISSVLGGGEFYWGNFKVVFRAIVKEGRSLYIAA